MKLKARTLLFIDGMGALATALMTGLVLPRFFDSGGMPRGVLYTFAAVGLLCCAYSLSCRFLVRGDTSRFLKGIIAANTLYALATTVAVIQFYDGLNSFGVAYFVGEVVIILVLVGLEVQSLKVSHEPY
jgi:hypothetical protein